MNFETQKYNTYQPPVIEASPRCFGWHLPLSEISCYAILQCYPMKDKKKKESCSHQKETRWRIPRTTTPCPFLKAAYRYILLYNKLMWNLILTFGTKILTRPHQIQITLLQINNNNNKTFYFIFNNSVDN